MGKSAVVLILDANHTMNKKIQQEQQQPNPSPGGDGDDNNDNGNNNSSNNNNNIQTRFDCAKQVAISLICDLMIQSKTNEVGVIVLKTPTTSHHLYDENDDSDISDDDDDDDPNNIPYKNITEIGGSGEGFGISKPKSDLLRQISKLQPSLSDDDDAVGGDFVDGIIVGADALQKRTGKRKYIRRLILLTDAEHKIIVNQELFQVIDGLRNMDCQLEVIGFDFTNQYCEYNTIAATASSKAAKPDETKSSSSNHNTNNMDIDTNTNTNTNNNKEDSDSETDVSGNDDEDDDDDEGSDNDVDDDDNEEEEDEGDATQIIKQQNEPLLLSLTEKTGGFVMSAREIQPILNKLLGQRQTKSSRRNVLFQIAPTLSVQAKFFLLVSKSSVPSLTRKVTIIDEEKSTTDPTNPQPKINSLGEEMYEDLTTLVSFWDPENQDIEIWDTTKAYWYGSDLIPMGGLDMNGLINPSPVKIQILGYMPSKKVPREYRCGPTYGISGGDDASRKASAAISALAQGLYKLKHVAIATMVKGKDADPILVGLFPLVDSKNQNPKSIVHLVLMQLPFEGDVPSLPSKLFTQMQQDGNDNDKDGSEEEKSLTTQEKVCDDFIDSLMLPEDKLDYTKIPNPYIRSFNKTVIKRVIDPKSSIVSVRRKMTTTSTSSSNNVDDDMDIDDDKNKNGDDDDHDDKGGRNNNNNDDYMDYDDNDLMATPTAILRDAQSSIDAFRKTFQIKTKSKDALKGGKDGKKKKRKGPATWRDFVDDDDDDNNNDNNKNDDKNLKI